MCTINKCSFYGLISARFLYFLCFSLVISLFKMASNRGLKSCLVFLSIGRLLKKKKKRKAVMCLVEGQVFKKLRSGMSYSAVGHEFDDNESTTYIG